MMGFVSGPQTAQGVDREFERWTQWLASRSGQPTGLLVYVCETLAGVSTDHIVSKKKRKIFTYDAIGGYLDLSQMKLDVHKGTMETIRKPMAA
jgi:hypothetical protein